MSLATPPKRSTTPCRIGSSASWRVALRAAWMPVHSAEQWSTATKTATWPCSSVKAAVMSFAIVLEPMADDGSSHIASTLSGMIVPSWARGP